jgi:hypothetical protein
MKHVVHPSDRASREPRIREVTFEKFDVVEVIEIAALAGDEIVSDADTVVPSHQLLREMGSDEPGAACDEIRSHTVEGHGKGRSKRSSSPGPNKREILASLDLDDV